MGLVMGEAGMKDPIPGSHLPVPPTLCHLAMSWQPASHQLPAEHKAVGLRPSQVCPCAQMGPSCFTLGSGGEIGTVGAVQLQTKGWVHEPPLLGWGQGGMEPKGGCWGRQCCPSLIGARGRGRAAQQTNSQPKISFRMFLILIYFL